MYKLETKCSQAWQSMLEDCKSATSYIYFEQFILQHFEDGQIGKEFTDVFKEKARQGVEVKLVIDAVGSFRMYSNIGLQEELKDAGVELVFFGVVPRWKARFPFNLFHRDHRKLLLVDDRVAHIGGVVVWEEARDWDDIQAIITDSRYIRELKGAFLRIWDELMSSSDYEDQYDGDSRVVLKTDPDANELYGEILNRIKRAHKRIVVATPYLSPNKKMFKALKAACKRGVEIDFYIPKESDSWLTGMVTLSYLNKLHVCKIRTHFFVDKMNHGKFVLIDDWVTLGSMNFDRLSFFYNRELNVVLDGKDPQIDLLLQYLNTTCERVKKDHIEKMGRWAKIKGKLGKIFRPIA